MAPNYLGKVRPMPARREADQGSLSDRTSQDVA